MVVRMRHTKGHRNNRRSHHKAETERLSKDKESNEPHVRHRANMETGRYRGRVVFDVAKIEARKAEREKRKMEERRGQGDEPPKDDKEVTPEQLSKH